MVSGHTQRKRTLMSWSSGKDSAWALHRLKQRDDVEIAALLTTINEHFDRVAMHGVPAELLDAQARLLGYPLIKVPLPWPCSNEQYEKAIAKSIAQAKKEFGITHIAFGDLFLEDIRSYREKQTEALGLQPMFPIWKLPTKPLAETMIETGVKAVVTCLDPKQIPSSFAGRFFDRSFLEELPQSVDPCGENGEFHTFVFDSPTFSKKIDIKVGEIITRDGFVFTDIEFNGLKLP